MEPSEKKPLRHYMRALHRDLGSFAVGLTLINALSGTVQIHRDTDLLKSDTTIEKTVSPDMGPSDLGQSLRIRNFKVTRTEGDTVYFREGMYDRSTGSVAHAIKDVVFPPNLFIRLHKATSRSPAHWFAAAYGVLLLFLAISSFRMLKRVSGLFRRGVCLAGVGIVVAARSPLALGWRFMNSPGWRTARGGRAPAIPPAHPAAACHGAA